MHHPILERKTNLITYIIVWSMVAMFHTLVLWLAYHVDFTYSVMHSLVHNILFAFLGLSIWFVVMQNTKTYTQGFNSIINHLGAATLAIGFWIAVSNMILNILFPGQNENPVIQQGTITWRSIVGVFYYSALSLMYYLISAYQNLKERFEKEADLRALLRESELKALKSQINPHFLFNSLNSISALTFNQAEKAREMTIKLSEFMRYTLKSRDTQFTSLHNEIENIKKYLEIEKIRFGEKLNPVLDLHEDCLQKDIPHLLLQPLIENAIKHGVYESLETNTLMVTCQKKGGYLELKVINDIDPDYRSKSGEGLGLTNVTNRLKAHYGDSASLIRERVNNQYIVTLLIPLHTYE